MRQLLFGLVCLIFAPAALARPPARGPQLIEPGLWAVRGAGPVLWLTGGNYYPCANGLWATTRGADAGWFHLATKQLPDILRWGIDGERHAEIGLCPGDDLPPNMAAQLGGASVLVRAGLPRIVRTGADFAGWSASPAPRNEVLPPVPYSRSYMAPVHGRRGSAGCRRR